MFGGPHAYFCGKRLQSEDIILQKKVPRSVHQIAGNTSISSLTERAIRRAEKEDVTTR